MTRDLAVSPFLTGDPVRLGADVTSRGALLAALDVRPDAGPAVVALAPRVALVHVLDEAEPALRLRVALAPHAPALGEADEPVAVVLIVAAPLAASGTSLRLAARLRACFHEPGLVERVLASATREALARVLAPVEERAGEAMLAAAEVLRLLDSSPAGLASAEASRRLRAVGPNRIERVARRAPTLRFLAQFSSFFAVLLWIGAGLAVVAGLPQLGVAIAVVIVVNGVFAFFQEYRAERAVEALQRLLPRRITTRRDGRDVRVDTVALVPGDVVRVEEGDQIAADGQILDAAGCRVDQSLLTGESHPTFKLAVAGDARAAVPRVERPELVFAGSSVVGGSATFVVTGTAMVTEIGTIARLTQTVPETPSPLQREMARVTRVVTTLAVSFGVAAFVLGVLSGLLSVADGVLFAVGVIVANVPEGLLPTLTLALAYGAQRLARQGSLMKRLSAAEALGATTVVCTDKTGTLTRGAMAARFLSLAGRRIALDEAVRDAAPAVVEALEAAVLASQATLERGDPTEVGLVAAAADAGIDAEKVRDAQPLLAPYPFDSFRKRMTLVRAAPGGPVAYVKGAPEETLALCDSLRDGETTVPLTPERRAAILADHDRMAADGLRLLAVAVRRVPAGAVGAGVAEIERGLTFLGLVALWDPPRPEVPGAVALCRTAGIRVVMITGDHGLTARAIARRIGLPVSKVVAGDEIDRLPPDAVRRLVAEPGVLFARTSPAHKLTIVTALQALGEVVAVTGDGVNDAPALKAADIGVAMGRRGSDVAKEAAEMVITDDNFRSIVAAIREGRATYANMGKFVTYIFASNVPELVPFLAFVLLRIPLPLTIMQILAVDLGTDLLPALALGAEPPEPDVMQRPPRARDERLLGAGRLLRAYAFLGAIEAALAMLAFVWTYWLAGWRPGLAMAADGELYRRATTMTLAAIVAGQVGNVFACRTDRESVFRVGLLGNRLVLPGIAVELALLLALITIPPLRAVFGLAPLALREWAPLLGVPAVMLLAEEGRKALRRASARRAPRRPAPPGR